jgi:plastocyanin
MDKGGRTGAPSPHQRRTQVKLTSILAVAAALATAVVVAGPAAAQPASTGVIKVTAMSQGLMYNTKALHAKAGKIKLVFTNQSMLQHDVRIEIGEKEYGGTKKITKGTTTAYLNLKKGKYNFYCSVAGHEDAGMKGTLTVS